MTFRGWPAEAVSFYAGLEVDNTKAFWEAHRATYETAVRAPFLALSEEVAEEFGPLHLFRPYRDVRFSKDKTPYKTAAGAVGEGEGGSHFFAQVSAEGLMCGAGYHHLHADQLERWRTAVASDRTGPELEEAVAAVRAAGLEVGARESLKRAPKGFTPDHPRIELLRWKGCHASRAWPPRRWLSTREAYDRIVGTWRAAAPLTDLLDRHIGPSEMPPDDGW